MKNVLVRARDRRKAVLGETKAAQERQTPSLIFYSVMAQSNSVIFGHQSKDDTLAIGASIPAINDTSIMVCA